MKLNYPLPLNIAHRGARSLAPENTLAAARKGYEAGADWWELDVAMTADRQMVILHDDTLKRTSNVEEVFPNRKPYAVHDFTLAELRQLDFGSWFNRRDPFGQVAAGIVTEAEQESYVGEPIPTLREALLYTWENHWKVNVEIKDASQTPHDNLLPEAVAELILELEMQDSVLISSFNHSYIQRVKALIPQIRTGALVEEKIADPLMLLKTTQADAFNPGAEFIQPSAIAPIRNAGYDVYIWTVNDAETMHMLIQAGVSGLFTDFPQLMTEVLKAYEPAS